MVVNLVVLPKHRPSLIGKYNPQEVYFIFRTENPEHAVALFEIRT